MKKIIMVLLAALCFATGLFAQEAAKPIWDHGDNVSDLSYRNVNIFRILDQADSYIVYYEKQSLDIGQVAIPKSWFKTTSPKKLDFRNKPAGMGSYMTVLYKGGEFYKVLLTVNPSRLDSVWGVAPNGTKVDVSNTESLDIQF